MVLLRIAPIVLAFVTFAQGFCAASELAPADEYFGPFHQSILEIRNRLTKFESESSSELAGSTRGIDNIEVAIADWYHRYPRDPWIPGFLHRTMDLYARIGSPHTPCAQEGGRILARFDQR